MTLDAALSAVVAAELAPVLAELRGLRAELAAMRAPEWLDVATAADRLHCTAATVRTRARQGDFVSRRCGRKILISGDSLRGHSQAEVDAAAREARS